MPAKPNETKILPAMFDPETKARFKAHVVESLNPNGCHIWIGAASRDGYGQFNLRGKVSAAHRCAWVIANNQMIPQGQHVLHSCDTKLCVNPAHLRAGTHKENMQDKAKSKQRAAARKTKGGTK